MATALNTWAKLRAPILAVTGTGAGVGIPLARGGRISSGGVVADTYNIVYEGPVLLSEQYSMFRTDFNPANITGTTGFPQQVRSPYFTANSPFSNPGSFVEWNAGGPFVASQTLTDDQKGELIGRLVTTTTTFFNMTSDAFNFGQSYTPGAEAIVSIDDLTQY